MRPFGVGVAPRNRTKAPGKTEQAEHRSTARVERKKRGEGRPRKGAGRAFPTAEVDRALVHGEVGEDGQLHYPSYRELAERYGVAHSGIAAYARAHNCLGRRDEVVKLVQRRTDEKVAELVSDRMAVKTDDLLRILDTAFREFEQALKEGRVRFDNVADFNLLCRLRAFLSGEAESRKEVRGLNVDFVVQKLEESIEVHRKIDERPALAGFPALPWHQQGKD
jgi:hypothetical protein